MSTWHLQTERAWTLATAGTFDLEKPSPFTEKRWSTYVPFYLRSINSLPDSTWDNINTTAMAMKDRPVIPIDVIEVPDDDDEGAMYSDSDSDSNADVDMANSDADAVNADTDESYDSQEDCDALIVSLLTLNYGTLTDTHLEGRHAAPGHGLMTSE